MPYLTAALLTARVGGQDTYVSLTDDDGDNVADAGVTEGLLEQVDEIVNGFARRGGYVVPLAVGDILPIVLFLLDIANYKARTRGGRQASDDDRKLYDDAMKVMMEISTGEFKLPSFTTVPSISFFGLDSPEDGPFFSRETLRNM